MRTTSLLAALGLLAAPSLALAQSAPDADVWRPGKFMAQAVARAVARAKNLTGASAYGFHDASHTLYGAFIHPGRSQSITIALDETKEYIFLAAGDDDVRDLDLFVTSPSGKVLNEDVEKDAAPLVTFSPPVTGRYSVKVQLPAGQEASFCALVVLVKGGYTVPVEQLQQAITRIITYGESVNAKIAPAIFAEHGNWSLAGSILEPREQIRLGGIELPAGRYAFLAAGDAASGDLDLALHDGDEKVGEDADDDAVPRLVGNLRGGKDYAVIVKNLASKGPSLTLSLILDLQAPPPEPPKVERKKPTTL
jgi:hypothetical protein